MPGSVDDPGDLVAGGEGVPAGVPGGEETSFFDDFDRRFAATLMRFETSGAHEVALAAALASHSTRAGQACVSLAEYAGRPWPLAGGATGRGDVDEAVPSAPALEPWLAALQEASTVGAPGEFKPLVLDGGDRLYLHRYWAYENQLAGWLRAQASSAITVPSAGEIASAIAAIEERGMGLADGQKRAVATALLQPLSIIAGGAGTGKTTIIACILRLLAEFANGALRVRVAAPTGKAANRLGEQLLHARQRIDPDDRIASVLDAEPATLHRLLGSLPDGTRFRHDAKNPLPLDVLIVDETSMVDLALMWKLVRALPPGARLVLVGDPEQLPPVEVGTVFAELSGAGESFTREGAAVLASATGARVDPGGAAPLPDCVVTLDETFRFADDSGIGALAGCLRAGDAEAALSLLSEGRPDLVAIPGEDDGLDGLLAAAAAGYAPMLATIRAQAAPRDVIEEMNRFRVLAVHREGDDGVAGLNAQIEEILSRRHGLQRRGTWYAGRMVMVTRNLHTLRLFNGDVGIALPDEHGALQVWFETGAEPRAVAPGRLSHVETVFAMTVHKSQGSEYAHTLLALPRHASRLLSRELLYTAATRARERLTIAGPLVRIHEGLARTLPRSSALAEALRDPLQ